MTLLDYRKFFPHCAWRADLCTHNHRRKRLPALVADVEDHLDRNGPWKYKLSDLYYEPPVTAEVEKIAAEEHAKGAT